MTFSVDNTTSVNKLSLFGSVANGALSSIFTISFCHPAFTLKTRLMSGLGLPHPTKLYTGFQANLACDISNQAVAFFAFSFFTNQIMGGKRLSDRENLLGGIFSGCATAPLQSCLERIMILQQVKEGNDRADSMRATIKKIIAHDGFEGFSKGIGVTMLRESVNASCFFCLSQLLQRKIERYVDNPIYAGLAAYQLSGAIAGLLSTPFDLIKTRLQKQLGEKTGIKSIIRAIPKEDLLKGAAARVLTISSTMMIMGVISKKIPQFFPECLYQKDDQNEFR